MRVGIVDAFASRTIFRDAQEYSARNDPTHVLRASQFSQVIPPGIYRVRKGDPCDPQGWYGEETLDVEAVHAMAPGANIVYAGAKSCFDHDIDVALNNLVDGDLVDLVSNSYGNLGEDIPAGTKAEFDQIATRPRPRASASTSRRVTTATSPATCASPRPTSRPTPTT